MAPPSASPHERTRGVVIAVCGVLAVSPDAMLLRWMHSLGASGPDVACAKYMGIIAYMLSARNAQLASNAAPCPVPAVGASVDRPLARLSFLQSLVAGRVSLLQQSTPHFLCSGSQLLYQLSFTFSLLLTDAAKALY